jgi:hypothetical protein
MGACREYIMVSGSSPSGWRARFSGKKAAMRLAMLLFTLSLLLLLVPLLSNQGIFAQSTAYAGSRAGLMYSSQRPSNGGPNANLVPTDTSTPVATSTPGTTVTPTPSPTPTKTPTPTRTPTPTPTPTNTPTPTDTPTDTPTPAETFTPTSPPGTPDNGGGGGGGGGSDTGGGGLPLLLILLLLLGVVVLGGGGFALYYFTSSRPQQPGRVGAPAVGRVGRWGGGALWGNQDEEYYDEDDEYYDEDDYEDEEWDEEDDMWEDDDRYYDPRARRPAGPMTGAGPATGAGWGGNTGGRGVSRPQPQSGPVYPPDDDAWPPAGGTGYGRPPPSPRTRPGR